MALEYRTESTLTLTCDCERCSSSCEPVSDTFKGKSWTEVCDSAAEAKWQFDQYTKHALYLPHKRSAEHLKG